MNVNYDPSCDVLTLVFRNVPIAESDEEKGGMIADYDQDGNFVSLEILDASQRVSDVTSINLSIVQPPKTTNIFEQYKQLELNKKH